MNQGTASLSMKSLLSPLAIPDSDNINVDSGLGTQTSCHLLTDCLLSPVHPSVWKSASPHARFGIDIGGTLCKVVFFEPLDSLDSTSLLNGGFQPLTVDALFGKDASHVEKHVVNNHGSTTVSEECFCSSKLLEFSQDPQEPRKMVSIKPPSLVSGTGFEKQEGCMYNVDADNMDPNVSGVNRAFLRSDGIVDSISDSNKEFAKYCKSGFKLWVSSHDPIILHGRGALFFKCFETWRMEEFLFLTREHSLVTGQRALGATGGGARKFRSQFLEIADLHLSHFDELKCLVQGIDFLMNYAPHESFEYPQGSFQGGLIQRPLRSPEASSNDSGEYLSEGAKSNSVHQAPGHAQSCEEELSKAKMSGPVLCNALCQREGRPEVRKLYPYLVINIGSGVSILLVESREQFKRVGGTSLGGSTFLGLVSALTGCTSFKEAIELAAEGDSTEIDMLVGDIYGGDYSEMGLAATTVASSFGKLVQPSRRDAAAKTPQHLAKATLLMITNNIGSLAKLHAQSTGVEHVLFTGSFMHGNKLAMRLLAVAMEFWSKGQIKAMFLRHGGHAGAMGALLNALDSCNQMDALLLS